MMLLFLALVLALWADPGHAEEPAPMTTLYGTQAPATERSVKCDAPLPAWVSTKRLADCASATLVGPGDPQSAVVRFVVTPTDPLISQGHRAEVRDLYEARNGEEVWYRFTTILPGDYPFDPNLSLVTAQWHEHVADGAASKRPPLAHRLVGADFLVTLWNDAAFDPGQGAGNGVVLRRETALGAGAAYEYVYRIVWKPDGDGRVIGWRRGGACAAVPLDCRLGEWSRFIDHRGPIGYADVRGYYFKMGVYTTHAFAKPLVIYHRDYRRGASAASIGAVERTFQDWQ